jgi:hypothetical protein
MRLLPKVHIGQNFQKSKGPKEERKKKRFGSRKGYMYIPRVKEIIKVMIQVTEKLKVRVGFFREEEIEAIKSEYFIDSNRLAATHSKLAKQENNDCVVRAFMAALDIPYDQSHAWVKKELHRIDKRGTLLNLYGVKIIGKTKNGKKISFIGTHPSKNYSSFGNKKVLTNKKYKKPTGYTLKSFMENNPVGRFVLIVQGHAVAVINGVLYGNKSEKFNGLYRSVWYGFEMK